MGSPPWRVGHAGGLQISTKISRQPLTKRVPQAKARYSPEDGWLQMGNGRPLDEEAAAAHGNIVFRDTQESGRLIGMLIGPDANTNLQPFGDAGLGKYGGGPGKRIYEPAKPVS